MQLFSDNGWQRVLWKIVTHPVFEASVVLAIVVFAAWTVVQSGALEHGPPTPLIFGR